MLHKLRKIIFSPDTDTYSGDWKEVVVVGGDVVDEDSRRMSASNWVRLASKFDLRIIAPW